MESGAKSPAGAAPIPSLDGLRAVSIALVLLGHLIPGGEYPFGFRALFLHADLGVRVFFVISGYLITSLLLEERSRTGGIGLRYFYVRRALRILPAFLLFAGCVWVLSMAGMVTVPVALWVYVMTYTVNYASHGVWALGHLWSLSVEEQFYLLWPLAVKLARPSRYIALAVLAIAANPLMHLAHRVWGIELYPNGFELRGGAIAMGCLLAIHGVRARQFVTEQAWARSLWSLAGAMAAIALLDAIPKNLGVVTVAATMVTDGLVTLCLARVVFLPGDAAGRLLNRGPLVVAGKLSYSLYLWQQLFLSPDGKAPIDVPFPLNLLIAGGTAAACYWGVEARFLGLRKRYRPGANG